MSGCSSPPIIPAAARDKTGVAKPKTGKKKKADAEDDERYDKRLTFSSKFACPVSGFTIPEIEPRLFSFNNPFGACPACDGLGVNLYFDPDLVVPDPSLSLLWYGRAAEANDPAAQSLMGLLMEAGIGLPSPQAEIAERYWRLAAYAGYEDAEVEFADRLRRGAVLAKPENGDREAVKLLERAISQESARAALQLARAYRNGELGVEKDILQAVRYAFQAIKFSQSAEPLSENGSPFIEIAAGHQIVEIAKSGEALTADGRPMFSPDEIGRMERYYGKVDAASSKVKALRLTTRLACWRSGATTYTSSRTYDFWVWDWDREESPTESQLRYLERSSGCADNKDLRDTLQASFQLARKNKVAFADLIAQQIRAAVSANEAAADKKSKR